MSVTFTIVVEFYIDGAWLDVTRLDANTRVLYPINITWGRTKDLERMASGRAIFQVLDNLGVLDDETPASPYYRKMGVGTPARITVDGDIRINGELASNEPEPGERPGINLRNVEIAGLLRRLDMPQSPLRSAAYYAHADPVNDAYRVFYAPLEEESGASSLEVFNRRGSIAVNTPVTLGGDAGSKSSARLVTLGTSGSLEAQIPTYTSTEHKVTMLWRFPEAGLANGSIPLRLFCAGGNVDRIDLRFNTPWAMILDAVRGSTVIDSAVSVDWTGFVDQAQEFWMTIELTQNGSNVDCFVGIIRESGTFGVPTDTLTGVTIGRILHITVGATDISGTSFGQLAVASSTAAFDNYITLTSGVANGVNGYRSELADGRLLRLLSAHDIVYGNTQATLFDAAQMGTQQPKTLGDLVYETVDTDAGVLIEHRLFAALVYTSRFALYNQAPAARIDWDHISQPFKPTPGDVELFNDMTVTRSGGSSARYAIPDGDWWHRTTEVPPDGVGPRPGSADINLYPDDQLSNHAAWRAHVSSWRERRFNEVTVELHRSVFTSQNRSDMRFLQQGDVLAIDTTDSRPYVPYNELRLLVQGGAEEITQFTHRITFNTTPADVYEVNQVDADGSYLAQPIDNNDTAFKISPPTKGPAWSDELEDLPYRIQIAGQPMQVDSISMAVTGFISAGAVATGSNASVVPALPVGPLQDSGDSFWLWATIRNSGTGTVSDIANWERIADFGNSALFACHYTSNPSIVAPTVAFAGGVANATTQAQIFAFSNLSLKLASGTKGTPAAHTQLNSAATNIGYPAVTVNARDETCTNMIFAWRQDDFTSIAPPAGYTEMSDSPTTTGDDAGIWAGYDLTGASGAAGSLVVTTAGGTAISRAVVVSVRPLQSINVVRGIDSTPTAAAVGAEVRAWRMGANAL